MSYYKERKYKDLLNKSKQNVSLRLAQSGKNIAKLATLLWRFHGWELPDVSFTVISAVIYCCYCDCCCSGFGSNYN